MHILMLGNVNFGVVGVFRDKQNSSIAMDKPFYCKLTIQSSYDDFAVGGRCG